MSLSNEQEQLLLRLQGRVEDLEKKVADTDAYATALEKIALQDIFVRNTGDTINGTLDIVHTATEADDHTLELDVDAAGHGDVKAIDIDYITGAIAAGEDEGIILVNIDETAATGGDIFALEVLATDGSAGIYGLKAGALIGPIHQDSGTFANPTTGTDNTPSTDVPAMIDGSTGTTTAIFEAQDEYIIIGAAAAFEEIEFILTTTASVSIKPTLWYSTSGTAQFTEFTPVDGTNGFRNTGVIAWDASDLSGHVADDVTNTFDIKIIRTKKILGTTPVLGYAKVAATTEYIWDKDGNLTINDIVASRVGINQGTPLNDLHIKGTANPILTFETASGLFCSMGIRQTDNKVYISRSSSLTSSVVLTINSSADVEIKRDVSLSSGNKLAIGTSTLPGIHKFHVVGNADEIQTVVQAHSSQTNNILEIQKSDTTVLATFDGTGKLGIGGLPSYHLDINSGTTDSVALFESTDGDAFIYLKDSDTTADDKVRVGADADNLELWAGGVNTVISSGTQVFFAVKQIIDETNTEALLVRKNSDGGDVLVVDTTNTRVGIGASSPQSNLHIESGVPTIRMSDNDAGTDQAVATLVEFYCGNNTNRVGFVGMESFSNDNLKISTDYAAGQITLGTGSNVTALTIDNTGKVGIGVASPDGTLHVHTATAGSVTANAIASDLVVENSGNAGLSILSPDASSSCLVFGSPTDNYGAHIIWNHDADLMIIGTANAGAALVIQAGNQNEVMRILNTGSVGIGTTSPAGALTIDSTGTEAFLVRKDADGGDVLIVDTTNSRVGIGGTPTETLDVDGGKLLVCSTGDVIIGGVTADKPSANGGKVLVMLDNGNLHPSMSADGSALYSKTDGGVPIAVYEMWAADSADNRTQLTPHNKKGLWEFHSTNIRTGKTLIVDMERLVKFIDKEFATDFVNEFTDPVL